jgi:serine/threonine protein phosphatase 1
MRLPLGDRIYAIGDIHGCLDKLRALHDAIRQDVKVDPPRRFIVIHLGDYIDRGPDSSGVIEHMMTTTLPCVHLMGNHEATALAALAGDGPACADWLAYGGDAALRSWGQDPEGQREAWRLPEPHLRFMRGLGVSHREGPYLFVHAGVRPGIPLDQQDPEDLLRIRRPFLDSDADHGAIIVHGHTPTRSREPERYHNRVNLDTGAVYGGPLTCGVFEGERVEFLSA